jgi:predicted  nucleic acid-binding Zn-ribbon protein
MVKNVTQLVTKLLLPFAVSAKDREEIFTKEMEMATILCLAESERRKSEGFILKKPAEKLIFIAEACYPIWLVPWRGRSLLFDGFGAISHTLTYNILPDIKTFINDLQGTAKRSEAYSAFLSDALNYFQGFKGQEEKTMDGLVASSEFIQDFVSYIQEAKTIQRPILEKAFLAPTLDETTLSSSIQDFSNLRATLKEDIASLRESMRMLNATTREHVRAIRMGIKETRKEFNEKIEELKPSVLEKVQKIQKKYDDKIIAFSKKFNRQLHQCHQECVKLEKTKKTTAVEIKHCETKGDSCKLRKDGTGEAHWRQKLEEYKKKLSALEKEIVDADKKLEDAESIKRIEISKIRSESNVKAEAAMKPLRKLEASRDAKIQMGQQEIKSLEEATSAIVEQIDKLIATKRAALNELEGMGIVQRRIKYRLAYLPVYLVCYQANSKKRYVLYSPSFACSMGIKTKFKRVFGVAKIKSLLQQRSKCISSLLNELLIVIGHNPVFEREISDAGVKANILRTKDLRKRVRIGLERLADEGWISENEFQTFSKLLTKA